MREPGGKLVGEFSFYLQKRQLYQSVGHVGHGQRSDESKSRHHIEPH